MRLSKLVVLFWWCAACADSGPPVEPPHDSGTGTAGMTGGDGDGDGDAGLDAGSDSGASGAGGNRALAPEELATESAIEDIGALECREFSACGGDVLGTWNVESVCVSDLLGAATLGLQNCAGILTAYDRVAAGTMRFTEDGMLEADVSITGTQHLLLDEACTQSVYGQAPSEELCATYEAEFNDGALTHTASCAFEGGACECDVEVRNDIVFTGEYTVVDMEIDDGVLPAPFCIDGDSLDIRYEAGTRSTALSLNRAE